jgi:predicted DsbA family dithiol-disulfide isomerase
VPISFVGLIAYGIISFLTLQCDRSKRARLGLVALSAAGLIVSSILLTYANQVIHATCLWCVASGICLLLLFVLSVVMVSTPSLVVRPPRVLVWSLALMVAIGIGFETGIMQRKANMPPIPAGRLSGLSIDDLVDPAKSIGPTNSVVTVVVFADFWCSACRMTYKPLLDFQNEHSNKVRLAYRNFPLFHLPGHQFSGTAAGLSEMAAEKGKYWDFADILHAQPTQLNPNGYLKLMETIGFSRAEVEKRLDSPDDPAVVRAEKEKAFAEKLGINSTPTYILLVEGYAPVSANPRTLPRLLSSKTISLVLAGANVTKGAPAVRQNIR